MLRDEQAAELLRRCESIVGFRLEQVRGNLRKAESRSSAVWELIVLEEASRIGNVEYEPFEGGSPDILLELNNGRKIWIEVAFLYPRFWKQERQSRAITEWIAKEANKRNISPYKVSCRFDGDLKSNAGPVRFLPNLHEKKKFIKGEFVQSIFHAIELAPNSGFSVKHPDYSVEVSYNPRAKGPYLSTGGGLVQESPKNVKEHAVYRIIKGKSKQHDVEGVRLVCIGSDQSHALSSLMGAGNVTVGGAVSSAFLETCSISGAIVVNIEDSYEILGGYQRLAKRDIYLNEDAKSPIDKLDLLEIQKLNFNRWKYYYSLEKYDHNNNESFKKVDGALSMTVKRQGIVLEVPANLLIDSLAGKTNMKVNYLTRDDDPLLRCLDEGWTVKGVSLKGGDIENGESPKVVLELEPPFESVFWPKKKR